VLHKLSLFIIWIHLATSVHTKRAVMDHRCSSCSSPKYASCFMSHWQKQSTG
jgi:hypothetical protein